MKYICQKRNRKYFDNLSEPSERFCAARIRETPSLFLSRLYINKYYVKK